MTSQEELFVKDLEQLSNALGTEIAAHDFRSDVKRKENIWFVLFMKIMTALAMVVSGGAAYLTGDAATAFAWLGVIFSAVNFVLTSWYASWAPGDERAQHILAIGQKSAIQGKIKLQLIAPNDEKQNPTDFYKWIHEQAASVGGSSPYLSQALLSKFAKKTQ